MEGGEEGQRYRAKHCAAAASVHWKSAAPFAQRRSGRRPPRGGAAFLASRGSKTGAEEGGGRIGGEKMVTDWGRNGAILLLCALCCAATMSP